jgi:hypothetical protein
MSIDYNKIILDQPKDGYGVASNFYDKEMAGKHTDIFDSASAQSEFAKAVSEQDWGTTNKVLKVSQMMLEPADFVAAINDSIDRLDAQSRQWYERNFGNGYRLVVEAGGFIPPYVGIGRAV